MGRTLRCLATEVLAKILRGWRQNARDEFERENVTIDEGRSSRFKRGK
jgi:hypothetical protein